MQKKLTQTYDRLIDANFNRAKEGLRVCEDICRFIYDQKGNTRQFKSIRHKLTELLLPGKRNNPIYARNIEGDVGKETAAPELKRRSIEDVFYANSQRVKESIRVLEEFTKIKSPKKSAGLKKIRYQVYALERKVASRN